MAHRKRLAAFALLGLAAAALVAFGYARQALRQVRPFYAQAIKVEPQALETASRQMENRVAALYSDAKPPGQWTTVFSDDEVNGWLAVALEENYADLLPLEVNDPRIAFADDRCLIGFHYRSDRIDAVVSVEAEAFMAADDVAAVRLRDARVGSLPIPMSKVVDSITEAAGQLDLAVRWTHLEEDPVLLVSIGDVLSTDKEVRQLKLLKLRPGELLLTGSTAARPAPKLARQTGG